jgi:CDP-diglyceride synthetase
MRGKLRSRAGKDRLIAYALIVYLFLCRFSRFLIALVSLGVAIFATYEFIGAVRSDEGEYAGRLIYWFVACLAWFHTKYAFDKKLTETRARLIDYGYLGVAAMGVIFFALAYSEQRYAGLNLPNRRTEAGNPFTWKSRFVLSYAIF